MRNEWQRLNTAMRPVASICDSHRTALPDARSAASNGSPTNCSRSTAPPCATRTASAPSPRQLCCARSATQPGSTASPSSPAGAAPAPSRSHQAKAQQIRSSTGSTSEATGASTACFTSPRSAKPDNNPKQPPTSPAKPAKAKHDAKHDEPTNATSPTESSAECGETKPPDNTLTHSPLDKGASDSGTVRPLAAAQAVMSFAVHRPPRAMTPLVAVVRRFSTAAVLPPEVVCAGQGGVPGQIGQVGVWSGAGAVVVDVAVLTNGG